MSTSAEDAFRRLTIGEPGFLAVLAGPDGRTYSLGLRPLLPDESR